jgi:hypothetical protein
LGYAVIVSFLFIAFCPLFIQLFSSAFFLMVVKPMRYYLGQCSKYWESKKKSPSAVISSNKTISDSKSKRSASSKKYGSSNSTIATESIYDEDTEANTLDEDVDEMNRELMNIRGNLDEASCGPETASASARTHKSIYRIDKIELKEDGVRMLGDPDNYLLSLPPDHVPDKIFSLP